MRVARSLFFFLIAIFISLESNAQNDSSQIEKRRKFAISLAYEGKYCFRKTSSDISYFATYHGSEVVASYTYKNKFDIPKNGFSTTFSFSYLPIKNMAVNIGFGYSTFGYKTELIDTLYYKYINSSGSTQFSYNQDHLKFSYSYYSIPVSLEYIGNVKKLDFIIGCGIEINYLKEAKVDFADNTTYGPFLIKRENPEKKSEKIVPYYNIHLGINYNVSNQISIGFISAFNYQKDENQKKHLYSIGIGLKLIYKL